MFLVPRDVQIDEAFLECEDDINRSGEHLLVGRVVEGMSAVTKRS